MARKRGWRESSGFVPKGERSRVLRELQDHLDAGKPLLTAKAFPSSMAHRYIAELLVHLEQNPRHEEGMRRFTERLGSFAVLGARWSDIAHNPRWPLLRSPRRNDPISADTGVLLIPTADGKGRYVSLLVLDWNGGEYSFIYPE